MSADSSGRLSYLLENLLLLPGIFSIVPMISVAWSLSYEFCFYLALPLLVAGLKFGSWRRRFRVTFLLSLACLHGVLTLYGFGGHVRLIMFIVGMLLYETLDSGKADGLLSRYGELLAISAFCFGLAVIGLSELGAISFPSTAISARQVYRTTVLSGTLFTLVLYALAYNGILGRVLGFTPLRWLGNMSYSYYLLHGLAMHGISLVALAIFPTSSPSLVVYWGLLPVALGLSMLASAILYLFVEAPFSLGISVQWPWRLSTNSSALRTPQADRFQC
jgi:peptidoglycan/LPS O-acetylase OafA/YrhL